MASWGSRASTVFQYLSLPGGSWPGGSFASAGLGLEFDPEKFKSQMGKDPEAVKNLFAQAANGQGSVTSAAAASGETNRDRTRAAGTVPSGWPR